MKLPGYETIFVEDHGLLCDIYVLNASLDDWQRLIDFLKTSSYPIEYFIEDERQESLPERSIEFFNDPEGIVRLIKVHVGDLMLHSHCFTEDEIEFDLVPEEVTDQEIANSIFLFMENLSKFLKKPVRLTPENLKDFVLVEYNADGVLCTVWSSDVP